MGILAFGIDTAAGLLFGKRMNLLSGGRFNPIIGAAGILAFPMVANAAGQIASVVAGAVLLALMGAA